MGFRVLEIEELESDASLSGDSEAPPLERPPLESPDSPLREGQGQVEHFDESHFLLEEVPEDEGEVVHKIKDSKKFDDHVEDEEEWQDAAEPEGGGEQPRE